MNGAVQMGGGGTDVNGHGTHVAGIVGAGENGIGVVGVAPEVTILPVRANANGVGPNSDIGKGITWAVDHGAKVINVSIGSDTKSQSVSTAGQLRGQPRRRGRRRGRERWANRQSALPGGAARGHRRRCTQPER